MQSHSVQPESRLMQKTLPHANKTKIGFHLWKSATIYNSARDGSAITCSYVQCAQIWRAKSYTYLKPEFKILSETKNTFKANNIPGNKTVQSFSLFLGLCDESENKVIGLMMMQNYEQDLYKYGLTSATQSD